MDSLVSVRDQRHQKCLSQKCVWFPVARGWGCQEVWFLYLFPWRTTPSWETRPRMWPTLRMKTGLPAHLLPFFPPFHGLLLTPRQRGPMVSHFWGTPPPPRYVGAGWLRECWWHLRTDVTQELWKRHDWGEDYPGFKVMATIYPGQSTLHPHLLKRRLGTLEQKVTSVAEMNYGNIGICVSWRKGERAEEPAIGKKICYNVTEPARVPKEES